MATSEIKTALITGASSGIGREMALWWARKGVKVYAAARRKELLEQLAKDGGGNIEPFVLDVSDEAETVKRIQALDDACGGLDLVVANAGVGAPTPGDLADWPMVEKVLRVNVMGAAATLTAVAPRMAKRGHGHLAAVSSMAGYLGLGSNSAYSGSKAFVTVFLECLQTDFNGTGVKVTIIEPGFVKSEMTAKLKSTPFIGDTDVAADKFCRAIARGARRVRFPTVHALAVGAAGWLPASIFEPIARKVTEPQRRALVKSLSRGG
jgi:short-subunit dehydrogenase